VKSLMGLHGLDTAGAAQVLVNEHVARRVLARGINPQDFVTIVDVRPAGREYVVAIKDVRSLVLPTGPSA
jgi:hypothetical protein